MGGLLDANCNPGSATPEMLHRIYASRGAASANPCILRELNGGGNATGANMFIGNLTPTERISERESLMASMSTHGTSMTMPTSVNLPVASQPIFQPARRRADSPPRGHFHAVNREYVSLHSATRSGGGVGGGGCGACGGGGGACSSRCVTSSGIQLTLDSLKMGASRCKVHPR